MKILMINVVCGIRSTGRICTDLATALEEQGHEVKIAYGREKVPEQFQKYAVRIGTDWDIRAHGLKARLLDGAGFGSKKSTKKFIEWVKEYDPDVIHLHNLHGYYINIGILFEYLRICGKRIIWTLHDCWAFTGHCAYFDFVECYKWKNMCQKCPQKSSYPSCKGISFAKTNFRRKKKLFTGISCLSIVTPSYWLEELVKESFLKEYSVQVIHNGINTCIFRKKRTHIREKYHIDEKPLILGVASVWNNRKGMGFFEEIQRISGNSFNIVLVGADKKQKLPETIMGIERTENVEELVEWYNAADIFLNPTLEDNYPTVNLEALCCGTPVITFDTGGSRETIPETYREMMVETKKTAKGLLEKIEELQKESINRDMLSEECRDIDNDNITQNAYLNLYMSI